MFDLRWKVASLFRDYKGQAFEVLYWDGKVAKFGVGPSCAVVHFKTKKAFHKSILNHDLGFGEAYVSGDVKIDASLEGLLDLLTIFAKIYQEKNMKSIALDMMRFCQNLVKRSLAREKQDIEHHYGRGDDFYKLFIGETLQYSCAYFQTPDDTIEEAQKQKIEYTTSKLNLAPGQRLLDIGCGWGHLMFYAARHYGVSCVGITLCDNQAAYIREYAKKHNLPVEVRVQSYLELPKNEKWDRIVSVGMMCHIGQKRIDQFYDKIESLMNPHGICLLHCVAKMKESPDVGAFVEKYIFPGYWFNSLEGMVIRSVDRGFNVIDIENLRRHYALTLYRWLVNFRKKYDTIKATVGFNDASMRAWEFYFAIAAAGFRSGAMNLLQVVMSKGINDDYPMTRDFLYHSPEGKKSNLSEELALSAKN